MKITPLPRSAKRGLNILRTVALLLLSTLNPQLSTCFAQGSLTPPGAPAPTMKTLEQIEPRIPIATVPYTITAPGSYYLTTNFLITSAGTHGITITSSGDDVTLDLNGFELRGDTGTGDGIRVSGTTKLNLRILNGTVRGWGGMGVNAALAVNSQLENLRVSHCGGNGIQVGDYSIVRNCLVIISPANGIVTGVSGRVLDCVARGNDNGFQLGAGTSISGCTAWQNQNDGIVAGAGSTINNCAAYQNSGDGIDVGQGSKISDCTATDNGSDGILAVFGSTISGCTVTGNPGNGIRAGDNSTVSGCTAFDNAANGLGATGIFAGVGSTVVNCTAYSNRAIGIEVETGSTVSGCTARANGDDGINAGARSTVVDCTASSNTGDGIEVSFACSVRNNNCDGNGNAGAGAGIHVAVGLSNGDNRIEGNNVTGNDRGIDVDNAVNLIIRNSARDNSGGNYEIVANNRVGTIVVSPLSGVITGNGPGAGSGATDPFANFAF